jgi:ankyrin repeat protein
VKLVLAELEERAMEGLCTIAEIENLTTSIPTDLEELYFKIVEKIGKRDQAAVRECQTILRWVAYSPKPLDVEQMREILAVSLCGNSSLSTAQIARHRVRHVEELRRRITNRCGNLLEIRRGVVQFVHQTAREYILRETKSDVIQLGETASSIEIGRFCKRYLDYVNFTIEGVWKSTNLSRSGVGWASADLENYVAGITNRQPVLADFCLDIYRLHAEQYSVLSVGLDEVVQDLLAAVESTYQLLEGATLACIIHGDKESLKKLIRAPEQLNRLILVPGDLENIDHFVAGSFPRSSTTRHWSLLQFAVCLKVGADYIIKALLRLGADPNFRDETGQTPLFQAVELGSSLLSYTLVSTTMKDSFDDADGGDPEGLTSEYSNDLKSEDFEYEDPTSEYSNDLKSEDFEYEDPTSEYYEDELAVHRLGQAVAGTEWNSDENGFVSTDKLSRRRRKSQILSADPMVTDHTGNSPLSMALKNHNYELARGLLVRAQRRGFVTAESEGLNIHNYLYETCRTGNTRAFDVLADFTDNWNFYDNDRRTLLHVAAANGHQEIVSRLLLRPCLDLEWKDREGQTALEVAVLKQHHTVTTILEKKGYN